MINYLVLSGGGQTIFDYTGIFKVLFEKKYLDINTIKSIYGTSSGSIIGALLCLKYDWEDIVDYIIRCPWENKLKIGINVAINIFQNNGIYDDNLFICLFKSVLNGKNLSTDVTLKELYDYSNIELHIYTFELNEFITIDLSYKTHPDCKLLDALRMSCSIPLMIKPICIDNKCYIDGGVKTNYPIAECLNNENCNEKEILGFKNYSTQINIIDENSNIGDYLNVILKNCLKEINPITKFTISNEIKINTMGISAELLLNAVCDINIRKKMVNAGIELGENYINSKSDD